MNVYCTDARYKTVASSGTNSETVPRTFDKPSEGIALVPMRTIGLRATVPTRVMARLVGINHIALEVGDVEEALAWYGSVFELEIRARHGNRMAFIDLGDQFIALAAGRMQPPDGSRHFGLVVDDKEAVREALREQGVTVQAGGSLDFRDPWGNHVQVVDYREIQFTKTPAILRAMKLEALSKSEQALAELRAKGLGAD